MDERPGEGLPLEKIRKHVAIIVSGGRTGTRFFSELLPGMIDGSFSVHEPDLLALLPRRAFDAIKVFGWRHMIFDRIAGRTGIRNLSQRYLTGRLTLDALVNEMHAHRDAYYESLSADYVIEAYYQWFGILPGVPKTFENYKVIAIVRDPRQWVRSWMGTGGHYGSKDWMTYLGLRRLDPAMVGDEDYIERWSHMSPFERNCWDWKTIYTILETFTAKDRNSRMFHFEDLFESGERKRHFSELLDFMTRFPDRRFSYHFDEEMLSIKRNVSIGNRFPHWREWDRAQTKQLDEICGPLMRAFGYGTEPAWRDLVNRA
jgi:hypothetical protein